MNVIAFDVFGTVFDLSAVDREEIRAYVQHVHKYSHRLGEDGWRPLNLPASWQRITAHPDAREGLRRLREKFYVVTLSNGPIHLLTRLSKQAGLSWDAMVPLECEGVYKPHPDAYRFACDFLKVEPGQVRMVTANEKFGDLEAATALGMQAQLIRGERGPATIIELAELLEA